MDLLKDRLAPIFARYFVAALGSTAAAAIYGLVDMIAVGRSQGPDGVAALAVILPTWTVIYAFGLMLGIGGGVLFSKLKGKTCARIEKANEYFTAAVLGGALVSAVLVALFAAFDREILMFSGARGPVLALAREYVVPLKFALPFFLFSQILGAFLRNDNAPNLAMTAVLVGGAVNIFGDWFFVFPMGWGMWGAGLATCLGAVVAVFVQCAHAFRPHTLAFRRPTVFLFKLRTIAVLGFAAFVTDLAIGIVTILFNRQILALLDNSALAVYGVLQSLIMLAQCCGYAVGQAAQPILSINHGAGRADRVRETFRHACVALAGVTAFWFAVPEAVPNACVRLFMTPTPDILACAPDIIRLYALTFLLLPFNIYIGYHFQSVLRPNDALVVSLLRGLFVSGALVFLLPALFGPRALWLAMPATEVVATAYALVRLRRKEVRR